MPEQIKPTRAAIHPADLAAMNVENAGQKYRPSNGTEGDCFFSAWCRQCARDKALGEGADFDDCEEGDLCDIIAKTYQYPATDDQYPIEWQYGKDGQPCCSAFVPKGEPLPPARCKHTPDMFNRGGAA